MKRDSFISSAIPADVALHQFDAADRELNVEAFLGAARDAVIEDLIAGKQVGTFWLRDVLDCALDANCHGESRELASLFIGIDSVTGDDRLDRFDDFTKYINGLVEAFVDRNAKLIEDRATDLAEQAEEDAGAL